MGFSKKFRFLSPSSAPTWPAHSDLRVRSYFLAFRVSVHDFCRRPTTRSYCLSFLSSTLLYSCNRAYSVFSFSLGDTCVPGWHQGNERTKVCPAIQLPLS